jgi:hypothetical protein
MLCKELKAYYVSSPSSIFAVDVVIHIVIPAGFSLVSSASRLEPLVPENMELVKLAN